MSDQHQLHWWGDPRKWFRALLMLDGTPHEIALGAAIGMFIALTPTVGIQMLIVLTVALLTRPFFRFNKMAGLLAVYVSNPLTLVPLYWFNYTIGTIYFPSTISRDEFAQIFEYHGLQEWWHAMVHLFVDLGVPLLTGSLVVATLGGLVTYPLVLRLFNRVKRTKRRSKAVTSSGSTKDRVQQLPLRVH